MERNSITFETILLSRQNFDTKNVAEVMKEFTGIKIIEAVNMLTKDFPEAQKEQLMANIDQVIDRVL